MYFDTCDICEAHYLLEVYYNEGGWLHERPSNRRRMEATHVQLARLRFKAAPNLDYDTLSENGREIFHGLITRYKLPEWED